MSVFCLDTNTIAALTSGNPNRRLVDRISANQSQIAIPAMVVSEWLYPVNTIQEPHRRRVRAFIEILKASSPTPALRLLRQMTPCLT